MAAANKKGNQMLKLVSAKAAPNVDAIPEFCSTLPHIPPAPVTKLIDAASSSADPTQPCAESMFLFSFLGRINDRTHPMNNAMTGTPKKLTVLQKGVSKSPAVALSTDLSTISMIGANIGIEDFTTPGACSIGLLFSLGVVNWGSIYVLAANFVA